MNTESSSYLAVRVIIGAFFLYVIFSVIQEKYMEVVAPLTQSLAQKGSK
jgi:hypothetical protein